MRWIIRRPLQSPVSARLRPSLTRLERMQPWDHFVRELDRSRRFGRPLTLLQVRAELGVELDHAIAEGIESRLRSIDLAWRDGDALCLMLPETDRKAREPVRLRLIEAGCERGVALDVRCVSFPDDGITAGALLATLRRAPSEPPVAAVVASPDTAEVAASLTAEPS